MFMKLRPLAGKDNEKMSFAKDLLAQKNNLAGKRLVILANPGLMHENAVLR
jgi:hypothetical protein